ncbi:tetratricopeptide repeat protein [Nitrospirillum sp. BR 11163]|uniref:tetratricopeptide repeat protein n=1 Tax=Nitrospirillum sp. BR 11163 TaxID=3104323 RepID=UPI002AFF5CF4|nr:tetratricopeptide repeat protein [Nitrospirillum sp. BR 11163]MEA1675173.1 tetratricopeptide repeat protein [Nitrospirillum sp. BR 11163]
MLDDLKNAIATKRAIIMAGAGTTIAAVGPGVKHASWTGLIEHGLHRAHELRRIDQGTLDLDLAALKLSNMQKLLSAAETVADSLGQRISDGEFTSWLRSAVGELTVINKSVPTALARLHGHGVMIATTNYDSILCEACEVDPVMLARANDCLRLFQGEDKGILHLHGHWRQPESVVLGDRRYWETAQSPFQQFLQQGLAASASLVFVGCGGTLDDPNIGPLLDWIDTVLLGAEHRHYLLCRESEINGWRAKGWKRIVPLSFGPDHGDLPVFLEGLLPAGVAVPPTGAATAPSPVIATVPRPVDNFVGRDREVETVVAALLNGAPVAILGHGGIGKTGLTQHVGHDPRITAAFRRRVFVRLEAATTGADMALKIASALGLEAGPQPLERAVAALRQQPTLLILDNAETPWAPDPDGVRQVLAECGAAARILLSIRGRQCPQGLAWVRLELDGLCGDEARRLFLGLAGHHLATDPLLPQIVDVADGVPLAIRLLAAQADGLADLRDLWTRWQAERAALLRQGRADNRETDFATSVSLSLDSTRLTPEGRRLLGLLGWLPDGLARPLRDHLLGRHAAASAATNLIQLALAREEKDRLRLLVPVREVVRATVQPTATDNDALAKTMIALANLGHQVGRQDGQAAAVRITLEFQNINSVLEACLKDTACQPVIDAVVALAKFQSLSGAGTTKLLEEAAARTEALDDTLRRANCIISLGDIALKRSDHNAARARFEDALPLYQKVGDVLGEANCIKSLGDIALARSDHDAARARYEKALPLYQKLGAVRGEANCIRSLGDIALRRSDHDAARAHYEKALPLYQKLGAVLGEANCIKSLGNIALRRSDYDTARARYEKALPLYQKVGAVRGEANCIKGLGDIALARSDHDAARARYERALPPYRKVGNVRGEANCIKGLGDIALRCSDHDAARARFEDALPLYQKVGDVLGEANCIKSLGAIALARSDHDAARARFERALPLYQKVGNMLGEANCIKSLGDIALARSDHDAARIGYEKALPLYQKVGNVLGEANCIKSLGEIFERENRPGNARENYQQALDLYGRIPEPYSMGWTSLLLSHVAETENQRRNHLMAARMAWEGLGDWGRQLIAEHLEADA